MVDLRRRGLAIALSAAIGGGALAAPAVFAGVPPTGEPPTNCNAGRGNGSEGCDPGNSSTALDGSAGQNMGGDEGGPISGGTGAP
jgi:hypothetical protein